MSQVLANGSGRRSRRSRQGREPAAKGSLGFSRLGSTKLALMEQPVTSSVAQGRTVPIRFERWPKEEQVAYFEKPGSGGKTRFSKAQAGRERKELLRPGIEKCLEDIAKALYTDGVLNPHTPEEMVELIDLAYLKATSISVLPCAGAFPESVSYVLAFIYNS